jgi:hypothetical protein
MGWLDEKAKAVAGGGIPVPWSGDAPRIDQNTRSRPGAKPFAGLEGGKIFGGPGHTLTGGKSMADQIGGAISNAAVPLGRQGTLVDVPHAAAGGNAGATGFNKVDFANALNFGPTTNDQVMPGLINQLQQEAAGQGAGKSLGQLQLQNATDQGALKGAGMIASTKGINPGLAAKLAGDQTAAMQQNAANQAGQLGLQRQLGAQQALGNVSNAATGAQDQRLNALIQGLTGQNNIINASQMAQARNTTDIDVAHANAQAAADRAHAAQNGQIFGGLANGIGGALPGLGGKILGGFDGGMGDSAAGAGQGFGEGASSAGEGVAYDGGAEAAAEAASTALNGNSLAGQHPGNAPLQLRQYAEGGHVPGRAVVAGDSPKNDIVEARLSPGEIVIPRSKADDPEKAHRFIDAIMEKKTKRKGGGYSSVLQAKREMADLQERLKCLKKKVGNQ